MRTCNAEECHKRSAKGSILKKTTGLCPSRSYYSMQENMVRVPPYEEHDQGAEGGVGSPEEGGRDTTLLLTRQPILSV